MKSGVAQKIISLILAAVLGVGGYFGTSYILTNLENNKTNIAEGPLRLLEVLVMSEVFPMSPFYIEPGVEITGDLIPLAQRKTEFYEMIDDLNRQTRTFVHLYQILSSASLKYRFSISGVEYHGHHFLQNDILYYFEHQLLMYDTCREISAFPDTDPYHAESLNFVSALTVTQLSLSLYEKIYKLAILIHDFADTHPPGDYQILEAAFAEIDTYTNELDDMLAKTRGILDFLADMSHAELLHSYLYLLDAVEDSAEALSMFPSLTEDTKMSQEQQDFLFEALQSMHEANIHNLQLFGDDIDTWIKSEDNPSYGVGFLSTAQNKNRVREAFNGIINTPVSKRISEQTNRLTHHIKGSISSAAKDMYNGLMVVPNVFDEMSKDTTAFLRAAEGPLTRFFNHISTENPGCVTILGRIKDLSSWALYQVDREIREAVNEAFLQNNINNPKLAEGISNVYSLVLKKFGGGWIGTAKTYSTLLAANTSDHDRGRAIISLAASKMLGEIGKNADKFGKGSIKALKFFGIADKFSDQFVDEALRIIDNGDRKNKYLADFFCPMGPVPKDFLSTTGEIVNSAGSGGDSGESSNNTTPGIVETPDPNMPSLQGQQTGSIIAAAGQHYVGLKPNGAVVTIENWDDPTGSGRNNVEGWNDIVSVAAGFDFTAGLKSDGTVVVAGRLSDKDSVNDWRDITAISAGGNYLVGLKSDKTIISVGNRTVPLNTAGWSDVVEISMGRLFLAALKSDGTVYVAAGRDNVDGIITEVGSWRNIIAVAAGEEHVAGLKSDGTVVIAGFNLSTTGTTRIGEWRNIVAISAGWRYTAGLRADGTVIVEGMKDDDTNAASQLRDVVAISLGEGDNPGELLCLKSDGTVAVVVFGEIRTVGGWTLKIP
ncbi:MAG: hypothetical protein FWD44_08725 [Oscillospiraceae bacterium]|nr:hypothetical protein [Oscillospiraceae bacterium]